MFAFMAMLAGVTVLCVLFVDRPVAAYFNAYRGLRPLFQAMAAPSLLALPGAGVVLAYALAQRLRRAGGINPAWLTASVATLAGAAAKDELKWIFGRPWPEAWLKYGLYRFHPFTDSVFFGGFPSGHTAYAAAPLCVFWVLAPRFRLLWGGLIAVVMLGLVGADYHFAGDVLAGLLTGMACAWGSLVLMKPGHA